MRLLDKVEVGHWTLDDSPLSLQPSSLLSSIISSLELSSTTLEFLQESISSLELSNSTPSLSSHNVSFSFLNHHNFRILFLYVFILYTKSLSHSFLFLFIFFLSSLFSPWPIGLFSHHQKNAFYWSKFPIDGNWLVFLCSYQPITDPNKICR